MDLKVGTLSLMSSEKSPAQMAPSRVHWFRSTIFQVIVVGGVFFCVCIFIPSGPGPTISSQAPGMYNALNALGAGGLATPFFFNAAAAAGYGEYFVQLPCKKEYPKLF